MLEVRFGVAAEFLLVERTIVRAARRDERASRRAQAAREWRRRPCPRRIETQRTCSPAGSLAEQPVRRLGRVGAVEDEPVAALEPAGKANLDVGGDRLARGRPRPLRARRPAGSPLEARGARSVSSGRTTTRAACATASFSRAISSGVSPSTSACSSVTFVSRTTGASTTFVASSRPPSPASTAATSTSRVGELGERGRGQRLELRRPELLRRRAHARDRPLEVGLGAVDPDPLRPAAHVRRGVRARPPARRARQLGDRPGRGRLARSSRRRGSSRSGARDDRAARAAPGCARGRTPPARGSATR